MKKGDVVTIQSTSISGKPINEGKAKLIKKQTPYMPPYGFELWTVEFLEEPGEYFERFVAVQPIASK